MKTLLTLVLLLVSISAGATNYGAGRDSCKAYTTAGYIDRINYHTWITGYVSGTSTLMSIVSKREVDLLKHIDAFEWITKDCTRDPNQSIAHATQNLIESIIQPDH